MNRQGASKATSIGSKKEISFKPIDHKDTTISAPPVKANQSQIDSTCTCLGTYKSQFSRKPIKTIQISNMTLNVRGRGIGGLGRGLGKPHAGRGAGGSTTVKLQVFSQPWLKTYLPMERKYQQIKLRQLKRRFSNTLVSNMEMISAQKC